MNKWCCLTCGETYATYVHLPTGCYHYHQTRELTEEYAKEKKLREMLWFNHGCPSAAMYGDDGEMQCNNAGCLIDFKRMSIEDIETALNNKKKIDVTSQEDEDFQWSGVCDKPCCGGTK